MIRRCDLVPQYELYRHEVQTAINDVLESGRYSLGENVESFEKEFSAYIGCSYGTGVNSGTDALILALWCLNIQEGDEVITTPFTAIPTYSAIRHVGATPIFVDIDPNTFLIDLNKIQDAITDKTKAIVPVHLFGNVVDIEKLRDIIGPDIFIIEDCAQAHGASIRGKKAGSLGDLAAFSFYPTKNLGGYGDGGMVLTNNQEYNDYIIKKHQYGMISKDEFITDGVNSRLDEIQAAILRIKLKYLDSMNNKRSVLAAYYNKSLDSRFTTRQHINADVESAFHIYNIVCISDRNELIRYLEEKGIQTNIYYPLPLNQQKGYRSMFHGQDSFPNSELISNKIIALPFYPEIEIATLSIVAENINLFFDK